MDEYDLLADPTPLSRLHIMDAATGALGPADSAAGPAGRFAERRAAYRAANLPAALDLPPLSVQVFPSPTHSLPSALPLTLPLTA